MNYYHPSLLSLSLSPLQPVASARRTATARAATWRTRRVRSSWVNPPLVATWETRGLWAHQVEWRRQRRRVPASRGQMCSPWTISTSRTTIPFTMPRPLQQQPRPASRPACPTHASPPSWLAHISRSRCHCRSRCRCRRSRRIRIIRATALHRVASWATTPALSWPRQSRSSSTIRRSSIWAASWVAKATQPRPQSNTTPLWRRNRWRGMGRRITSIITIQGSQRRTTSCNSSMDTPLPPAPDIITKPRMATAASATSTRAQRLATSTAAVAVAAAAQLISSRAAATAATTIIMPTMNNRWR